MTVTIEDARRSREKTSAGSSSHEAIEGGQRVAAGDPALGDPELLTELTDFSAYLYAQLHLSSGVELAITLVDETEMGRLHLEWMDLPGPTDVMSFPMDELRPGAPESPVSEGMLGDIVLCPAVAEQQAATAGHSAADELLLLTVHGTLHLLGYDHETEAGRAEMFGLQKQLLEDFLGREAPVPTITDPAEQAAR